MAARSGYRAQPSVGTAQMHPCNRFKTPPDFAALAAGDEELLPFVDTRDGAAVVHWAQPGALHAVTRALLRTAYRLDWRMPPDQLCPTVPSRLSYVHCVADLVGRARRGAWGVDIGTGASVIYPLLGHCEMGWRFVATDISEPTLASARANVQRNGLAAHILVQRVEPPHVLRGVVDGPHAPPGRFAFTMCNPPFFATLDDTARNPRAATPAVARELVCEGGEVAFVRRMVAESVRVGDRADWYTTLLGKRADRVAVVAALHTHGVHNVWTATLRQGRTHRWLLAWALDGARQPADNTHGAWNKWAAPTPAGSTRRRKRKRKGKGAAQRGGLLMLPLAAGGGVTAAAAMEHVRARVGERAGTAATVRDGAHTLECVVSRGSDDAEATVEVADAGDGQLALVLRTRGEYARDEWLATVRTWVQPG